MTRIECNCKICKDNAARLGKVAPLAASVPEALLATCRGKTHGLVHMAHDPNALTGAAARMQTNVKAL